MSLGVWGCEWGEGRTVGGFEGVKLGVAGERAFVVLLDGGVEVVAILLEGGLLKGPWRGANCGFGPR